MQARLEVEEKSASDASSLHLASFYLYNKSKVRWQAGMWCAREVGPAMSLRCAQPAPSSYKSNVELYPYRGPGFGEGYGAEDNRIIEEG